MYLITCEREFYDMLKPNKEYEISENKLILIGSLGKCVSRRLLGDKVMEMLVRLPITGRFTRESFAKVCNDNRNQLIDETLQDLEDISNY